MTHLSEEQRHMVADGSLEADAHLRACADCSADVDRIRRLMKRIDDSKSRASAAVDIGDLWPGIRARIEKEKVVTLDTGNSDQRPERRQQGRGSRLWMWSLGGVAAAALIGMAIMNGRPANEADGIPGGDSEVSLVAVVDSTHAYQEEAQALLNRLELQRATMRPELARAVERDLRTIDVAIAELQNAIRTDPNNPALRRLLASSYRQKVDLLKRVSDAG